jgi:hypothetical protein
LFSFSFEKENNITTIEFFLIYRMQTKDAEFIKYNKKLKAEEKSHQTIRLIASKNKDFTILLDKNIYPCIFI